jgi:hypothetical protein
MENKSEKSNGNSQYVEIKKLEKFGDNMQPLNLLKKFGSSEQNGMSQTELSQSDTKKSNITFDSSNRILSKLSVSVIDSEQGDPQNIENHQTKYLTDSKMLQLSDKFLDEEDYLKQESSTTHKPNYEAPFETEARTENVFTQVFEANHYKTEYKDVKKKLNSDKKNLTTRGTFGRNEIKEISSKEKGLFQTVKEKKDYEDKIQILNNRIKILKKQEDEINKLAKKMGKLAEKDAKIFQDKNQIKNVVNDAKVKKTKSLEKKKITVKNEKVKRNLNFEKSKDEQIKKNKNIYDLAKTDKLLIESMVFQLNSHNSNMNNYKCIRVKQDLIQGKTNRFQKQSQKENKIRQDIQMKIQKEISETENLKGKLRNLEDYESECLNSLRKTIISKQREIKNMKAGSGLNMLNSSMIQLQNKLHLGESGMKKENEERQNRVKKTNKRSESNIK